MPGKKLSFPRDYEDFEWENLTCGISGFPVMFGEQLYAMPEIADLKGLKVLRAGLHLGTLRKGRFEPSHALPWRLKPGMPCVYAP